MCGADPGRPGVAILGLVFTSGFVSAFDAQPGTSDVRTALVSVLVMIWAVRLTANWVRTWGGPGHEDWRYVEIQKKTGRLYWLASLVAIHLFPALLVWLGMLALVPTIAGPMPAPFWRVTIGMSLVRKSALSCEAPFDTTV